MNNTKFYKIGLGLRSAFGDITNRNFILYDPNDEIHIQGKTEAKNLIKVLQKYIGWLDSNKKGRLK